MKATRWALVVSGLLLAVFAYRTVRSALDDRRANEAKAIAGQRLSAETSARLAVTVSERDSLAELLKAARQLNGTLIAGIQVRVPKRDTVVVHDTLVTVRAGDTRTATFRDSTFAGIIAGTVVAPPGSAPLGVTYRLTRPEFNPQVGIVRSGNANFAVVNWRGEMAEVQIPFVDVPLPRKRVSNFVEGMYSPTGLSQLRTGVAFDLGRGFAPSVDVGIYVRNGRPSGPHASVGGRYTF